MRPRHGRPTGRSATLRACLQVGIHLGDDEGLGEDPEPEPAASPDIGVDVPDIDIEKNEELKELREKTGIEKE